MQDPRSIANFILDIGSAKGIPISNLALNKIAYFLHGIFLAKFGTPLIDAKIEAWQYGPVFREIYHEFKSFGDRPIDARALKFDIESRDKIPVTYDFDQTVLEVMSESVVSYLSMRPGALVELSHVHDGPWHKAWFHDDNVNPGMEITNDSIESYFKSEVRH